MIRVRDLRVDYDDLCAVKDLCLDVHPGQVCGLIGPNGAGKTTTMRTMLGLIEPTYGEIELAGIDMRDRPRDACRVVGFMPDFPPIYNDLRCWEFLDLFAGSYFIPRSQRSDVVEKHLELVGLTEKRDSMVVELSRGMRQRLMMAKTLIPGPQVLLMDEPASGVDPRGRIDLKNILKKLSADGKTVLFSSHILAEMTEFCTAVAVMERGRMVISGTVEEIRARVMEGMLLLVEVLGPDEEMLRIVENDPNCGAISRNRSVYEIHFRGDANDACDLLKSLVSGGVRVGSFSRHKEGLEELFLKIGAEELS